MCSVLSPMIASTLDMLVLSRRKKDKFSSVSEKKMSTKQCIWLSLVENSMWMARRRPTNVHKELRSTFQCGVCCKVDALKDCESSELTAMLELRSVNRAKTSDSYDGVCCTCRRQRYGSMLQCRLCLELFHCTSQKRLSVCLYVCQGGYVLPDVWLSVCLCVY